MFATRLATIVVLIALITVWATGNLDKPLSLYEWGLNARDCYRARGNTGCGGIAAQVCASPKRGAVSVPGSRALCLPGVLGK